MTDPQAPAATQTAHTPGPWRAVRDDRDGCFDIATAEGDWIAEEIDEEENARLIAASPRMYDFIKNLANKGNQDAAEIIASI